jgi:opacity protein-like surface antigen
MGTRRTAWLVGLTLMGSIACTSAMADDLLGLYNPLGVYLGGGVGRATINQTQFDTYGDYFHHIDGQPLGWNAVLGVRPIPFLGAEAEYIDFGNKHLTAGPPFLLGGYSQQFLGGEAHDRAGAVFAVGYLPLPIPWVEPFAKLGWAQIWEHDSYSGIYGNLVDGTPIGQASASQDTHPSGAAYGAGLQFHFSQLAVRAQYERISGSRSFGSWNNPTLLSVGLNWTF